MYFALLVSIFQVILLHFFTSYLIEQQFLDETENEKLFEFIAESEKTLETLCFYINWI